MQEISEPVEEKLKQFFGNFHLHDIKKGEIFIKADEQPKGIFFIKEGTARRYFISRQGHEVTINIYKKFSFFPISWVIGNIHNLHYYEAMTYMKVFIAPKQQVSMFIQKNPDVLYDLLKRMYINLEIIWQHIEYLIIGDSYAKVLTAVNMLAKRFGIVEGNRIIVDLKISEKDLATYAGVSRETVSRELTKAKKKNLLFFNNEILIINNLQEIEKELATDY